MPCFMTECTPLYELGRFVASFALVYTFRWIVSTLVVSPLVQFIGRKQPLSKSNSDDLHHTLAAAISFGALVTLSVCVGWFMGDEAGLAELATGMLDTPRWYNTLALSVCLLNTHDAIAIKTGVEIIHIPAMAVLIVSYALELTRISLCVALTQIAMNLAVAVASRDLTPDWRRVRVASALWGLALWEYLSAIYSIYGDVWHTDIDAVIEGDESFLGREGRSWSWRWVTIIVFFLLHWCFISLCCLVGMTVDFNEPVTPPLMFAGVAVVLRVLFLPSLWSRIRPQQFVETQDTSESTTTGQSVGEGSEELDSPMLSNVKTDVVLSEEQRHASSMSDMNVHDQPAVAIEVRTTDQDPGDHGVELEDSGDRAHKDWLVEAPSEYVSASSFSAVEPSYTSRTIGTLATPTLAVLFIVGAFCLTLRRRRRLPRSLSASLDSAFTTTQDPDLPKIDCTGGHDDVMVHVLQNVKSLCAAMGEARTLCGRVVTRLLDIHNELNKNESPIEHPLVERYRSVVYRYEQFLKKYADQHFVLRLVCSRRIADQTRAFHEELDSVVAELGLFRCGSSASPSWTEAWAADRQRQDEMWTRFCQSKRSVAKELKDDDARVEALVLLQYEFRRTLDVSRRETFAALCRLIAELRGGKADDPAVPTWFLPPYEVECVGHAFGKGGFGEVYHGTWQGKEVVVKRLLATMSGVSARRVFIKEASIWSELNHPNIVRLLGACHVGSPFFVSQLASNGTLRDFLFRSRGGRPRTWQMLYQVSLGLRYLRHRNVIHSDLKCDNILVGADGAVMLTDFGLSEMRTISKVPLPAKAVGAIRWKAPEIVISGAASSFQADVYSFAMCIVEAVTEDFPWGSLCDASVRYHLRRGMVLPKPSDRFTAEQWAFIQKMAAPAPSLRPQIEVITAKLKLWADEEKYRDSALTSSAKQRELIEQLCSSASPQALSRFVQLLNAAQANNSVGEVDLKADPAGAEQRSLVEEVDVSSTAPTCTAPDSQEHRLSASLEVAVGETVATSAKQKSTAATDSSGTDAIAESREASDRQSERTRGVTSHRACSACGGNVPVECNFCVYCGVTMAMAC